MPEYKFVTDKIEVRSIEENNKPRYIVKGTAAISNKKHTFDHARQSDGSVKIKKGMFTPHFLESIREQSKHKGIFIDTQHELARNASVKALVDDRFNAEEKKQIDNMLKRKMLPLAKITDIDITGDKLDISTELNSMFREVDEDHKNYFDAVWYSLQNKFLNGISINFANFKYLKDNEGDYVFDDAEVLGFSFLDSPAEIGNSIYEVAIRSIEDSTGEKTMENEAKKLEDEKAKLEEDRKKLDAEKEEIQKEKDAVAKKAEEDSKKTEMEKQKEEQAKIQNELDEKTEAAKKAEERAVKAEEALNKSKGVVGAKPNPNTKSKDVEATPEFYKEKLKEITAEHDTAIENVKLGKIPLINKEMTGFGELVNLGAKAGNLTADLNEKNAEYARDNKLLDKSPGDLISHRG